MSEQTRQYESILAGGIRDFVKYKRALECRYDGDEKKLILLDRYLVEQGVSRLDEITPDVLDRFMSSRVRAPSSFNNLLSTVRQLFNWLVLHEHIGTSPLRVESKRCGPQLRPFLFDKMQLCFRSGNPANHQTVAQDRRSLIRWPRTHQCCNRS